MKRLLPIIALTTLFISGCASMSTTKLSDQQLIAQLLSAEPRNATPSEQALAHLPLLKELFFNREIALDNYATKGLFIQKNEVGGNYFSDVSCLNASSLTYDEHPNNPTKNYVSGISFRIGYKDQHCAGLQSIANLEKALNVKFKFKLGRSINFEPLNWVGRVYLSKKDYFWGGIISIDLSGDPKLPETKVNSILFDRSLFKADFNTDKVSTVHPQDACPMTGFWTCGVLGGDNGIYMRKGDPMPGQSFVNANMPREHITWRLIKPA